MKRRYSFWDQLCIQAECALHASTQTYATGSRANPAAALPESALTEDERKHIVRLMRINHSGEVCAQALYFGQAWVARDAHTRDALNQAALEEGDHLLWCQARLQELSGHTSVLNPIWYMGSLLIGILAASFGDAMSLGFIVETEKQVERHLAGHLAQLPESDAKTRAILEQMQQDEIIHGHDAHCNGASALPLLIQQIMHHTGKIMVQSAKWV